MRAALRTAGFSRPRVARLVRAGAVAALVGVFAIPAFAQPAGGGAANYQQDEVKIGEEHPEYNGMRQVKQQVLRESSGDWRNDEQRRRRFLAYYMQYLFPSLTRIDQLGKIADLRTDLVNEIDSANNATAKHGLKTLALRHAEKVITGNYHPAVQINGVLLLGELNDEAADLIGSDKRPPKPAAAALPKLVTIYSDANNSSGIRVAALLGIRRHAQVAGHTWTPAQQDALADLMLEVLRSDPASPEQAEQHGWLQRLSIDVLQKLRNPRRSEEEAKSIVALAANPKAAPRVRYYAASVMGRMPSSPVTPPVQPLTEGWAQLLAASLDAEATRLEKLEKPKVAAGSAYGAGGGYGMGGEGYDMMGGDAYGMGGDAYGGMGGEGYGMGGEGYGMGGYGLGAGPIAKEPDPQPPAVLQVRRRVNYQLQAIRRGLDGHPLAGTSKREATAGLLKWVAAGGNGQSAAALRDEIDAALAKVNDTTITVEKDYAAALRTLAEDVRALAGAPGATPPGDGDELQPGVVPLPGEEATPAANAVGRAPAAVAPRS